MWLFQLAPSALSSWRKRPIATDFTFLFVLVILAWPVGTAAIGIGPVASQKLSELAQLDGETFLVKLPDSCLQRTPLLSPGV